MNETAVPEEGHVPLGASDPRLAILASLCVPAWIFDIEARRILWANAAGLAFWHAADNVSLRRRDLSDMTPSVQRHLRRIRDDSAGHGRTVSEHWTFYPPDTPRSVETAFSSFALPDGRVGLLAHVVHEDGERRSDTLHSAQALLHTAVMVSLHDARWRSVYANPAARAAMTAGAAGLPDILERAQDLEEIERRLLAHGECDIEVPVRIDGGAWHAMHIRESRNALDGSRAILVSAVDITARRAAEQDVRRLAYFDTLTGLPNRVALLDRLRQRIEAGEVQGRCGVLLVDLDRFKRINDSLGFAVGDELLVLVAKRLQRTVGERDFIGRLGSDEFAIISDASTDAAALARDVLESVSVPMNAAGHRLDIRPSIGICHHPEHGRTTSDLLRHADTAMDAAKRGRLGHCLFDAAMDKEVRDRLRLESEIACAVGSDEFELYYQPRVASADGRVLSFEALVRWRHPERGLLFPLDFIDVAEECGLIVELGGQVMRKAMVQQRAWARAGYRVGVSINVSPKQFVTDRLLASVAASIEASGCDPSMIELEITESVLFDDPGPVSETLEQIRRLGPRIAIDDFGTGYSNLARLGHYPLDALKIDRSFVADPSQASLLEAIVAMGHALGLEIVAEGIETEEQARRVRGHGCHELQGYFYSRPLPLAEASDYLAGNGHRDDGCRSRR